MTTIFFVFWKQTPASPWTICGAYEDEANAQRCIGDLFSRGLQARMAS